MTQDEIKNKIAELQKKAKNPSLPASAVTALNKMIEKLQSQVVEAPKKETPAKKEAAKKAPVKKAVKKVAASPKKEEPKKAAYDCDELIAKAKASKAARLKKAKEAEKEPKKTPATKNKEAVKKAADRVVANIEKRASQEKGSVSAVEVEKQIKALKLEITRLEKILEKIKAKKMATGGSLRRTPLALKNDKNLKAMGTGERVSNKVSTIHTADGGSFKRRNANQFGATEGGNEYVEKRVNRTDRI